MSAGLPAAPPGSQPAQLDPHLVCEIREMAEKGMIPREICEKLLSDQDDKQRKKDEPQELEWFPDAIKIISQALAYRTAIPSDFEELKSLFNDAYRDEVSGPCAFREGPACTDELLHSLLDPPQDGPAPYQWLLVEAPNGQEVEKDGIVLGACCYSVDGKSNRNGEIEGFLGSIRLFGVLTRYKKHCIGRRLLGKVEQAMFTGANSCARCMVCIPSSGGEDARDSPAQAWVQRRGYLHAGQCAYPSSIGHVLLPSANVDLCVYLKKLTAEVHTLPLKNDESVADGKGGGDEEVAVTVLKLKGTAIEPSPTPVAAPTPAQTQAASNSAKAKPRSRLNLGVTDPTACEFGLGTVNADTGADTGADVMSTLAPVELAPAGASAVGDTVTDTSERRHLPPHWRPSGGAVPTAPPRDPTRGPSVTFLGQRMTDDEPEEAELCSDSQGKN